MIRRLRIKFVCINMAIVTIMLCAIFGTVLYFTKENLERESISMMQTVALEPPRLGYPGEGGGHVRLPYFTLEVSQENDLVAAGGGYYDLTDGDLLRELVALSTVSAQQTGILREYGLRFCWVITPTAQRIVFADISSEVNTMNHLVQNCLLIGGLSFVAFFIISLLLARWAVKPVEEAWKQQRQFVADASHELKTPLTVILSNVQLLEEASAGEALSPKELKDIFKRFYRADSARSRDGSYGLGLSIAEEIVRNHKGRIWAESRGGVNTFFVQLPLYRGK